MSFFITLVFPASTGTCFFAYGLKQGELCRRDNDCETGLMCADVIGADTRSCQPPVTSNKQYSKSIIYLFFLWILFFFIMRKFVFFFYITNKWLLLVHCF